LSWLGLSPAERAKVMIEMRAQQKKTRPPPRTIEGVDHIHDWRTVGDGWCRCETCGVYGRGASRCGVLRVKPTRCTAEVGRREYIFGRWHRELCRRWAVEIDGRLGKGARRRCARCARAEACWDR